MDYRDLINEARMLLNEAPLEGADLIEHANDVLVMVRELYSELKERLEGEEGTDFDKKFAEVLRVRIIRLNNAIQDQAPDSEIEAMSDELYTINDERDEEKISALYAAGSSGSYGTMNTERGGEGDGEGDGEGGGEPEPEVNDRAPDIPKGNEETSKKYVLDYSQPLEAIVMMFRAVYDTGTMADDTKPKKFFPKILRLLISKESMNEKHIKAEAKKFYELYVDFDEETKKPADTQVTINTRMQELVTFANKNAYEKSIDKLRSKIRNPEIKKFFTGPSTNLISAFYANFVGDYPFTTYAELKRKFPDPEDLESALLACIYQRFYYIFVMYRFATVIGIPTMVPDINKAKGFFALSKLMNKSRKSATDGKSGGSEANVQNILQQAMTQLLSIDTADITVMESYIDTVNSANQFMDEGLGDIIGRAGKAVGNAALNTGKAVVGAAKDGLVAGKDAVVKTANDTVANNNPRTMRVLGSIPAGFVMKANANKEEITKYPQVVVDFIIFLSFLLRRKAFSSEQFNILVKAKEINKINLMSAWLAKNKEISQIYNYIGEAIAFMVDAKENGGDGGASALTKMGARSPKARLAAKGAIGTAKLVGKGLGKLF